jgi:hypothetical protein
LSASSSPGTGPRCHCGSPYLRGVVLLPLVLSASETGGIVLAGSTMRDRPVESLTCKACGRRTVTRDLPPIGIDVAAVLEQLAAAGRTAPPTLDASPTCTCGSNALTWTTVVALTVHTAGATMLGEVTAEGSAGPPGGNMTCGACARSWDVSDTDLPARVREAATAFAEAVARGDVSSGD